MHLVAGVAHERGRQILVAEEDHRQVLVVEHAAEQRARLLHADIPGESAEAHLLDLVVLLGEQGRVEGQAAQSFDRGDGVGQPRGDLGGEGLAGFRELGGVAVGPGAPDGLHVE